MRGKIFAAGLLLLGTSNYSYAQQSVQPYVITGGGGTSPVTNCPVGSGTSFACPMPVTTVTTSSGATHVQTSALAANLVVKASPGNLYDFEVAADATLSGAAWWIMIYDATSAPADGAVTPAKCYAMTAGATTLTAAFPTPTAFTAGITIGVSTTGCFTKTASTHAFIGAGFQ
jgi:hypothetical protein